MANTYKMTEHAWRRWRERTYLEPVIMDQLERSVPFGSQFGDSEMRLMPCGLVAVIKREKVVTFLTQEFAIADMQAFGIAPVTVLVSIPKTNHRVSVVELARDHAARGVGKKARNQSLRDHGYDPCGEDGVLYRKHFNASFSGK
jgi:hypothetical protein